jgi:NADH dehydrogenase [ubiquinone] 1 alpha subcomplex assembly factor 1
LPKGFVMARVILLDATSSLPWFDLSDPVMGGRSRSTMSVEGDVWVFQGRVSLESGGGFASVRSAARPFELAGHTGLIVRARADGKRYGLRLRTTEAFDGVTYQADFTPDSGALTEVTLPFTAFQPMFRGRVVADHPPLDPAQIRTLGLIIGARQAGPFRLDLAELAAYVV